MNTHQAREGLKLLNSAMRQDLLMAVDACKKNHAQEIWLLPAMNTVVYCNPETRTGQTISFLADLAGAVCLGNFRGSRSTVLPLVMENLLYELKGSESIES